MDLHNLLDDLPELPLALEQSLDPLELLAGVPEAERNGVGGVAHVVDDHVEEYLCHPQVVLELGHLFDPVVVGLLHI